jgi:hypothetical protein
VTLRSTTTAILFAVTAALTPAPLIAQITTFVAPPRKPAADSTKAAVAAAATARADTTARMTLGNMKAWVDSAAGVSTTTEVAAADTSMMPVQQPSPTATPNRGSTTAFSNGAVAPNTASPLPFFLAGGFVLIFAGLGALRLARRRA